MLGHRRWSVISIAASFVLTSLGLAAVAPTAQAATVTTPKVNCTVLGAVALTSAIAPGDSLVASFVNCNGWTLSWTTPAFANAGTYPRSGNNDTTFTVPEALAVAVAPGDPVAVWSNGGSSITINQYSNVWDAKTPTPGTIGTAYSYSFSAPTLTGDYTQPSGSLPAGLTLGTDGVLIGTPTKIGVYSFAVERGGISTGDVSVTVSGPMVDKVTICHRTRATTNPYVLITVSVNSVIGSGGSNGHDDHNTTRTNKTNPTGNGITPGSGPFVPGFAYPANQKWWGDIIPPFTYSTGTYAGLNWGPTWNSPNPAGGSSSTWIEDAEFAAAIRASSDTTSAYYKAAQECMDIAAGQQSAKSAAIDDPDKYFKIAIDNGEDTDSVLEDLEDQNALEPSGNRRNIPNKDSLENTYNSTSKVTTDPATNTSQTSATLNGTLKSGTAWDSWKYEWSTSPTDVRDGSGSSSSYVPGTDPSSSVGAGPRNPQRIITGLTCGTTYFFRVIGTDSASAVLYGLVRSFRTENCNSGGGGGTGGNGNNESTNPPAPSNNNDRQLGQGRPQRIILPPAARPTLPTTPSTGGTTNPSTNTDDSPTSGPSTPPRGGEQTVNPAAVIPPPPGDAWVPEEVRLEDPRTGEPTPRVVDNQGTWVVNPRSGTISFTPAPNFVGTAVLNVKLTARSGLIQIQPIRIRVGAASRILVIKGGVPSDILGGILRWR